eukprot:3031788-Pleurochrysis_carterae.AAC.1
MNGKNDPKDRNYVCRGVAHWLQGTNGVPSSDRFPWKQRGFPTPMSFQQATAATNLVSASTRQNLVASGAHEGKAAPS